MADDFTQQGYKSLLEGFCQRGYNACSFQACRPDFPDLILRHDIDMSIAAALPIAQIEAELSMSANYFILLRSELYNPFSPAFLDGIIKIRELGHSIGLHFDVSLYQNDPEHLDQAAEKECSVFERMTGMEIDMVSFHRPAKSMLGRNEKIGGKEHSYQPKYFEDIGYVSDSRGGWHYGHPLDHPAVLKSTALQLLTHPIWWTKKPLSGPIEKLNNFVEDRDAICRSELAENCEPFRVVLNSTRNKLSK